MRGTGAAGRRSVCLAVWLAAAGGLRGEVVLQYFNTSWRELERKLPELAEVGYEALWLPPPTKGSGALSVGYDLWDPFDLGSREQRGTVRTRYGTEAELLRLVESAHRFGLRVYFDNIMNHRAFDVPGYNEATPIDLYPGLLPEDFHLRVTEDGFYRKWDNIANWSDTWQVQYRNFSDLIDLAQESPDNGNFGRAEGSHIPKLRFVRHPQHPEWYCYAPGSNGAVYVGFNSTNITAAMLTDPANAWLYAEDVNAYLIRAARWLVDRTRADGLRLDAVKHVPSYFFGLQSGAGKDASAAGYCGQAQEQFNRTRGFSDWDNHRDTVFNTEQPRDDLMLFGEHLGEPPSYREYIDAGMRLVDNQLHGFLNGNLGNPWGTLDGLQWPDGRGFGAAAGVAYVKSHDDDVAYRPELQYALNLTRAGLPNIYTDGNYQSETLGESGGAFPRHANTAFLGQFGDGRIPNLVYLHQHFARGAQTPRWGDADVVAYERIDKRENGAMTDADGAVLFFVLNDNYAAGQYREIPTSFPVGARLWQYASAGGAFYYTVPADQRIKVITPPGGYFAFSWRNPEPSDLWAGCGGRPITLYQDGAECGWLSYVRRDGPDGDPAFNPYGVDDPDPTDRAYVWSVPRVTADTNLRFVVRVDGSAANVLVRLDGGLDLNGQSHPLGDPRDHPPALATDVFLGYEQARFVHRQWREKFAARDTGQHNVIGSAGAETYLATVGAPGFQVNTGVAGRDSDEQTAEWVYHDPQQSNDLGQPQFDPPPEQAAGSNIVLWLKVGYAGQINRAFVYYTVDGQTYPEGAGGEGRENTRTVELAFDHADAAAPSVDWWRATLPPLPAGAALRYKLGVFRQQGLNGAPWAILFPNSDYNLTHKRSLMGVWEIAAFDARTAVYRPHNDYGASVTGLVEGFHVVRARAFLERPGRASIYNTFVQPFYLDARRPAGEIVYPAAGETLAQNEYGIVVRADATVTGVLVHIEDADLANDDRATGQNNGNGIGTNALGQPVVAWAPAAAVTPAPGVVSAFPDEWRFAYRNIPAGGSNATLSARLLELSSATNMAQSDAEGHFTTLTRAVRAAGPEQRLFFQWPAADGQTVEPGWTLRVYFSKSLGDGLSDEALRERFLLRVDGAAQGRERYRIARDVDGAHGELQFDLPDVFDGDPERPHAVLATHLTQGGVTLEAQRFIKVRAAERGPHVDIVAPPEYDSDGKPYEIVLPDVAHPAPEERQFTIRVETDAQARDVWIAFTNSTGSAAPRPARTNALSGAVTVAAGNPAVAGGEKPLSGTVAVTNGATEVVGTGTAFLAETAPGQALRIEAERVVVTQVVSDTLLRLAEPYPGPTAAGRPAAVPPAFDSELRAGDRVLIGGQTAIVAEVASPSNLTLTAGYPGPDAAGLPAYRIEGNPTADGRRQYWEFVWSNLTAGVFQLVALADTNADAAADAQALRTARVILRQLATNNPADEDDDDDGLYDQIEATPAALPETNPETWNNGDVHLWRIAGRTDPLRTDTDGDGLPDGLELGWRAPLDPLHTDTNADTNGDGFPNFVGDRDPPFFNTKADNEQLPGYVQTEPRTKQIAGSMTDPNNPDSDYDGVPDGIEDWNRNGWADGDGQALEPATENPWSDRPRPEDWPTGRWHPGWTETDPNHPDTDGDALSDGFGEDRDGNGWIAGDLNSNRLWEAGELWTETDPLNPDTDGDGLPDGWEARYQLDPLDSGVVGATNMRTGEIIGDAVSGAAGNPDGDWLVVDGVTNEYTNLMEYQNGTHPRQFDSGASPAGGSIVIGPGPAIGVLNGVTQYQEFADWTFGDCLALDEYEGDGRNHQQGDVYLAWDGWDSSRDLVAFYARDGGDPASGGDGNFYFRVDFHELLAHAEDRHLDVYVVIDTGNPAQGEFNLPDEVDAGTEMRWEAVVAVYANSQGRVYVDSNRSQNTTAIGQDLAAAGVAARDQNAPDGFVDARFDAVLDAAEFAVRRQALLDAGWNGIGASNLHYQVFTTKDGTGNDPRGGGDLGGRNDLRDSITDDGVAEDYWQAQQGLVSVLREWISGAARPGRAKIALVAHGNQAVQPGSVVQALINTGAGAGYYRALDAHEVLRLPLNLHLTPTLAAAIEWAAADPAAGMPWRDGPSFNRRLARLAQTNIVALLAGTFSDHLLPYFTPEFNRDNAALAREFLAAIYGWSPDPAAAVFWTPERVLDHDVFEKIRDLGYRCTVLDQDTHLFYWFGRQAALGDDGYRVNRINGVNCFAIHNSASAYRFANEDGGLPLALRALLNRKARSGAQDQVVTLFGNWEEFASKPNADAYDANLRWLANHPWVRAVALPQLAAGGPGLDGENWSVVERGTAPRSKQGHNWLNHATAGNYDNWYLGSAIREGLHNKRFEIRPGAQVPQPYGMLYTGGIVSTAWERVRAMADGPLARLARAALHASVFETAFHDETEHDLRRYSNGDYVYPVSAYQGLAPFARHAQAQTRLAAAYRRVETWAAGAAALTDAGTAAEDVDLDGEAELLLFNSRLLALFERSGGRLIAVWCRERVGGAVYQAVGNFVGYAGSDTEEEGIANLDAGGNVAAFRTSCLKDWWDGSRSYVNDLYTAEDLTNGWRLTSSDGRVRKTVTLAPGSGRLEARYETPGLLYVRNGLTPNLYDLLWRGQAALSDATPAAGVLTLTATGAPVAVAVSVGYADAGHNAAWNAAATDRGSNFATLNMRNQAQTHQVELVGSNAFAFALVFRAEGVDDDRNGLPDNWESQTGLRGHPQGDAADDADGDGSSNREEYLAGTAPLDAADVLAVRTAFPSVAGFAVEFPAQPDREYRVFYGDRPLPAAVWSNATPQPVRVPAPQVYRWVDDGSHTAPGPWAASNRFYRVGSRLPE